MSPDKEHACYQQEAIGSLKHICNTEIPIINSKLDKILEKFSAVETRVVVLEIGQKNIEENTPTVKKVLTISAIVGSASAFLTAIGKNLFNW